MKKFFLIIVPLLILVVCVGTVYFLYLQPAKKLLDSPTMTPQAQTARITSHLLVRKIEELKNRAVYLQHREEGRKLIELSLGDTLSSGELSQDEEYREDKGTEEKTGTGSTKMIE